MDWIFSKNQLRTHLAIIFFFQIIICSGVLLFYDEFGSIQICPVLIIRRVSEKNSFE